MRTRLVAWLFNTRGLRLSIALLTFVAFSAALWNEFVEWDDGANLFRNPHYRGLGWTQLRWMFTTALMGHYIPLTWVTFGLDYLVWGMNPLGYHLTNLLFHSANAVLFYSVALRLLRLATPGLEETTLRLGAAAAALFFAIHPLRVESVAWVTERRDVLSGLFFLLTILTYLKACEAEETGRRRWLIGSVACYTFALASKSIVMTLPFVLILLDIYPLRRLPGRWQEWTSPGARRLWAEKIPYLLLAVAGAGTALYRVKPFLVSFEQYPPPARVGMALSSLWFYVWKTVFPLGLGPMYELPARVNLLDPPFLVTAVAVAVITGGVFLIRRRWPAGLAVWVYYAVTLVPVSGIVHVGSQLTADRYSYLSCLGWALLVGAGVCAVVRARATGKLRPSIARLAAGGGTVLFLGLAALTWQQVQVWRDSDTLWRYAIEINPDCATCHSFLGTTLMNRGYTVLAISHFQQAIALRPDKVLPHHLMAFASARLGRLSEASEHYQRALELGPADPDVPYNLGTTLMMQGKLDEGIEYLRQAIRLNPANDWAHTNLGTALTARGNPAEAIEHFRRAIEVDPKAPLPRYGLARAYLALGKSDLAQEEYALLRRLDDRLASLLSPLVKP